MKTFYAEYMNYEGEIKRVWTEARSYRDAHKKFLEEFDDIESIIEIFTKD